MSTHEPTTEMTQRKAGFRPSPGGSLREQLIKLGLAMCAALSILTTFGIIYILAYEGLAFFRSDGVSFWDFISGTQWNPLIGSEKRFGVWALISGTLLVSLIAMAIAIPLGLVTAVYLSEYARPRVRAVVKPTLEVLAGIPTVVYGFFALTIITPALKLLHDGFNTYNAMSAGIAVGILCLPIVSSLVEDALQAVPRSLREGALGLGATKFEVSVKIVLPAALSGIISAVLLAISRAIGETMVVALAAGSRPQFTLDPRQDIQTMTGWMVQMALGDISNFSIEYLSLYAVAFVLFITTMLLTIVGNWTRNHFREVYAES